MLRESRGCTKHRLNSNYNDEQVKQNFEQKEICQTPYGHIQEIQEFSQIHFYYGQKTSIQGRNRSVTSQGKQQQKNWRSKNGGKTKTCRVAQTATAKGTQLEKEKTHLSIVQAIRAKGIRKGRRGFSAIKWWKNSMAAPPLKKPLFRPLGPPALLIWNETQNEKNNFLASRDSASQLRRRRIRIKGCRIIVSEKSKSENL